LRASANPHLPSPFLPLLPSFFFSPSSSRSSAARETSYIAIIPEKEGAILRGAERTFALILALRSNAGRNGSLGGGKRNSDGGATAKIVIFFRPAE